MKMDWWRHKGQWVRILLSFGVSSVLLILLFRHFDASLVSKYVRVIIFSPWILMAICISLLCNLFLSTEKWRMIFLGLKRKISFQSLLYLDLATDLTIRVLPLRSGELVKAWYLLKTRGIPSPDVIGTILLEMLFNAGALILLGLTGWIGLLTGSPVTGIGCALAAAIALLIVAAPAGRFIVKILPEPALNSSPRTEKLLELARRISNIESRKLAVIIFYSLLIEFGEIVNVALIFMAFSINVEIIELLAYLPAIALVSRLPVSIGGLGIRESSMILAFPHLALLHPEEILGAGLLYSFIEIILPALIGVPLTLHLLMNPSGKRSARASIH